MQKAEIKLESGDAIIDIALDTVKKKKQALIFVGTKRSAEKQAEEIGKKIKKESAELINLSEKILKVLSKPTKQCERLAKCIKNGVSFHHAGLAQKQKDIIEDAFRDGNVRIICCTPTLAAGVDLPAFRTIIKDLKRYGGKFGMNYIPVLEYLQMAGRAGRPKFDKYGEAILIAKTESEKDEIYSRYVLGEPEDIFSKLAVEPVLRTALLSLISTGFVSSEKEIMDFFAKSFWAHQFKDMDELEEKIRRMLGLLEEWEFIKSNSDGNDFTAADTIEDYVYKPTILGKRTAELYVDPLTAHKIVKALHKAMALKILKPFSFLHMISSTLEMRPRLSVRAKEFEEIQEQSAQYESYLLENEPSVYEPEYEDFLEAIKTALMFESWIEEKTEEYILETFNVRPGELNMKLNNGDWLLYCSEEICRILNFKKIIKDVRKARLRLKYGVKEELMSLLKLEGVGRARARKLFRNKLKNIQDIKKIDVGKLAMVLGPRMAAKIKEQLGEKVNKEELKVPKGRRKGQLSLDKF